MQNLFKDLITIKRRTQGALDSDGNPTSADTTIIANAPCRFYDAKRHELQDGKWIVREIKKVMMHYDSTWDIDEGDIAVISESNYPITKVYPVSDGGSIHHYELELDSIQSE